MDGVVVMAACAKQTAVDADSDHDTKSSVRVSGHAAAISSHRDSSSSHNVNSNSGDDAHSDVGIESRTRSAETSGTSSSQSVPTGLSRSRLPPRPTLIRSCPAFTAAIVGREADCHAAWRIVGDAAMNPNPIPNPNPTPAPN